ncbi:MAG: HEAT repeat domain-containing protein [Planctomycetes bacterium]|nr:HEAT repeat domain-containing protein [Planctomycetota bacterium]
MLAFALLSTLAVAQTTDRRQAVGELLGRADEQAYRAAKEQWRSEQDPMLRGALLRHGLRLAATDDSEVLNVLERETLPETRFVAARWFLEHHGKAGLDLLESLRAETKGPQLAVVVLAACAPASSSSPAGKHFGERFDLEPPTRQLEVLALLASPWLRHAPDAADEVSVRKLRSELAEKAKWPALRGEALRQLAASKDPKAKTIARRLAGKALDPRLAQAVFVALTTDIVASDLDSLGPLVLLRGSGVAPLARDFAASHAKDETVVSWALTGGKSAKSDGARLLALRVLENVARSDDRAAGAAKDAVLELVRDDSDEVARRAVAVLAELGDERVRPILEKHLRSGSVDRRLDALEGLARMRTDAAFDSVLLELAGDGPTEIRLLAIRTAARRGNRDFLPMLPQLLGHTDWRVVSAGLELARRVRDASSIPMLLSLLDRSKGRIAAETKSTLKSLTRLYFADAARWKSWWKRDGATFELPPPEADTSGPQTVTTEQVDGGAVLGSDGGGTTASFYGIPVESRSVAFCLDVSGSMNELVGTGVSRLSIAKHALLRSLERVPKGTKVHIIFFDAEIHRFQKRATTIDPKKLEAVQAFVDSQRPLGETNIYGALELAFADPAVDTIYLLSDGEPSAGEITDVRELGDQILRINRRRSVIFHGIAIGTPSALLERLSRESGGDYVLQK